MSIPAIQRTNGATAPVSSYRAAVGHNFTRPLTVDQVPRPVLKPGQVLVKVEACGLCHTDIHAAHGDWPVKPSPPFIPGHEGVGLVVELAPGLSVVAVGDRGAMPWLGDACGACDYCGSGRETLCLEQQNMGYLNRRRSVEPRRRLVTRRSRTSSIVRAKDTRLDPQRARAHPRAA